MVACFALADVTSKAGRMHCNCRTCALQTVNPRYRIWAVLAFLKISLFVINIQGGVFGILATYDVIPANRVLTSENRAIREWVRMWT